ncbi:peptidoglycan-binding protein [Patescibacteria group bacterium]|nr:peptidoglycan-binding protein [Patescibacteria group bacterium]
MDSDNKKITWKPSNDQSDSTGEYDSSPLPDSDMNARLSEEPNHSPAVSENDPATEIDALKNEIEQTLVGKNTPRVHDSLAEPTLSPKETPMQASDPYPQHTPPHPVEPSIETIQSNHSPESTTSLNQEDLIASLKQDIESGMNTDRTAENQNTAEEQPSQQTNKGVEHTYYSDLSRAMNSNEPATMSELIRKSRFEESERKILSPTSKRNIAFIAGAAVLLVLSIAIITSLFGKKNKVEFITEERVSSLVRSDLDTGINVTGIESSRIKQAIRDVIEMKIPEDSINQIYYVEDDGLGNLRRLGVKDIFDKTNNQTPVLLYDNIENTFTHGVYKSDKNYPFIIMKALSYDRALQGMMEWEPTMIDDLATYLDLPPEATDRSLLEEGFEDDLIENKNVRIARYLPRDVDRKGLLDFLGIPPLEDSFAPENTNDSSSGIETNQDINGETDFEDTDNLGFWDRVLKTKAYAQETHGNPAQGGNALNGTSFNDDDFIDGETVISGNIEIQDIQIEPICFDRQTGIRLTIAQQQNTSSLEKYCFESYRCYRYSCFLNNVDVGVDAAGEPGVVCRDAVEYGQVYLPGDPLHSSSDYTGPNLSCYQFYDLLALQNINNAVLCFNKQGQYIPNYAPTGAHDTNPNDPSYITCLAPQDRNTQLCISQDNQVYDPAGPSIPAGEPKLCFDPNGDFGINPNNPNTHCDPINDPTCTFTDTIDYYCDPQDPNCNVTDYTSNQCSLIELGTDDAREKLLQASFQLKLVADTAQLLGLSSTDAQHIREVAYFLEQIAFLDVLDIPLTQEAAAGLQTLEIILNKIDQTIVIPNTRPDGTPTFYGKIRSIIDILQCILGVSDTVWVSGELIPQGVTLYAGYSGEEVLPIQQTLAVIGLMDIQSVTGIVDVVTQDAVSQLQIANGLEVTGILDEATLALLLNIVEEHDTIFGETAVINDYFDTDETHVIGIGTYSDEVQVIQILLYTEGYDIQGINGLFDETMCSALQSFQEDQGLEVADDVTCQVSLETLDAFNDIIRNESLLGSGFILNEQGFLEGIGVFELIYGPGVIDFTVNTADADSLNEGDIVLMYMFLDEQTILIARDQIVINEVIRRRALDDIFDA